MSAPVPVQIQRDPFARASLMRIREKGGCKWCGRPGRFAYRWEGDSRFYDSRDRWQGPFCSIGCYRVYFD
jgi:hypothetical protein